MLKLLLCLGFDPAKHQVKTELLAGFTTFLTMSYILAVNPIILSDAGMDKGAVFSATVIAAVVATLTMAFYAKMPFALASGMGLNAFFAYTLVISMGYTWQQALAAVSGGCDDDASRVAHRLHPLPYRHALLGHHDNDALHVQHLGGHSAGYALLYHSKSVHGRGQEVVARDVYLRRALCAEVCGVDGLESLKV